MADIISRYSLGSVEKQQERFNGFFRGEGESEVSSAYSYTLQRESQSERDGSPSSPSPDSPVLTSCQLVCLGRR